MVTSIRGSEIGTRNGSAKLGARAAAAAMVGASPVKSDVRWFADMAHGMHPEKPGTILHLTTGVDERLCQKYAAGDVRPSSSFLRALLRSEDGWDYLNHIMHDSDAPWWVELQGMLASACRFHMREG